MRSVESFIVSFDIEKRELSLPERGGPSLLHRPPPLQNRQRMFKVREPRAVQVLPGLGDGNGQSANLLNHHSPRIVLVIDLTVL